MTASASKPVRTTTTTETFSILILLPNEIVRQGETDASCPKSGRLIVATLRAAAGGIPPGYISNGIVGSPIGVHKYVRYGTRSHL